MQNKNWIQMLADHVDLAAEPLPGAPIVELAGDRRIIIERHGGVTEYGGDRVCVRVCYGIVCIIGCGLELTQMTRSQLVISGRIDCVQLQRKG